MIEVRNVVKNFGSLKALDKISFTVEKGQIVGFLGANGAGKTTTMDIICGCLGADEGSVKVAGVDIAKDPIKAKQSLGYLPDNPPLYHDMIVRKAIEYAGKLHQIDKAQLRGQVEKVLEKLGLQSVQNRMIGNLSKGFRQRVAFAQALVHDPDVLVLDEPTEGLDPNQIVQMREMIRSLQGDHTIILSSHILSEVQHICDRLIIIHQGQIAKSGTYDELVNALQKEKRYRIRVGLRSQALSEDINSLAGVLQCSETVDSIDCYDLVVASDVERIVDNVAKVILEHDSGIKEIISQKKNLEDVFYQVTH